MVAFHNSDEKRINAVLRTEHKGVHFTLFLVENTPTLKLVMAVSMDYTESLHKAEYKNARAAATVNTGEFAGFRIPERTTEDPTHVVIGIYTTVTTSSGTDEEGKPVLRISRRLLARMQFIAKTSEEDMRRTENFWGNRAGWDDLTSSSFQKKGNLLFTVLVLKKTHFFAFTFGTGARLLSIRSDGGVMSGGLPRMRAEFRVVLRNTPQALGEDGDLCEFTVMDPFHSLKVAAKSGEFSLDTVRMSGQDSKDFKELFKHVRGNMKSIRIEGPDMKLSPGQLAALHHGWLMDAGVPRVLAADPYTESLSSPWKEFTGQTSANGRHYYLTVQSIQEAFFEVPDKALMHGWSAERGAPLDQSQVDLAEWNAMAAAQGSSSGLMLADTNMRFPVMAKGPPAVFNPPGPEFAQRLASSTVSVVEVFEDDGIGFDDSASNVHVQSLPAQMPAPPVPAPLPEEDEDLGAEFGGSSVASSSWIHTK
jgi:hypothetical protein